MSDYINLWRTGLCVTQRCTLKCKLCLAFIPYYENPQHLKYEEAERVVKEYFRIVDTVDTFTVTGGEPLLNPELSKILEMVYSYLPQIRKSVDFVTNGTLVIPAEVLDVFEKNSQHTKVVLSDYGDYSCRISEIAEQLEKRKIPYRISNFHGDDLYFDGWIDFRDHSKKYDTVEERDEHAQQCIHNVGKYFLINDGELHYCSRSYWRMRQGLIPRIDDEYVPLLDNDMPLEKKKEIVRLMQQAISHSSCAYCVGLKNGVPRYYPAEQL